MDITVIEKIIKLYKSGIGSVKISKKLSIPKHLVLKILNEHNLIRKRDRCQNLKYDFDGVYFSVERKCPKCGNVVVTKSAHKTIACRNHFNKITDNRNCKKCSLENQVGEGNPFFGKKHNHKTKLMMSKNRKGKATGDNNSMSNIEHREKARKKLKEKWDSGDLEYVRSIMSENMKKNIRTKKIKSFIKSKAEVEIKEIIESLGYEVKSSYRVDTKIFDIYVPELNLIIEYNGDYWHCNPKKYSEDYYNTKKSKTSKEIWEYDKLKLELVRNLGYFTEVIWESDYIKNKKLVNTIINNYDTRNKSAPERSRQDSDSSTPI
jgi:G:T-mismatch repair DNA endonuclease (very short patch repair protein)/predicted RNA-binding Zn-ribbon protein involved in translation (DUF1610 family)